VCWCLIKILTVDEHSTVPKNATIGHSHSFLGRTKHISIQSLTEAICASRGIQLQTQLSWQRSLTAADLAVAIADNATDNLAHRLSSFQ
jgi:hypothetical protein